MKAFYDGRSVFLSVAVIIFSLVALVSGCATSNVMEAKSPAPPLKIEKKMITEIGLTESDREALVQIVGDQELVFTSVKQANPPAVIFYFPDTALQVAKPATPAASDGLVTDIGLTELTDTGHTSRLEIALTSDAPYHVKSTKNGLEVSIQKPPFVAEKTSAKTKDKNIEVDRETDDLSDLKEAVITKKPAAELKTIETRSLRDGSQIIVRLDGTVDQYKSFTLEQPPRIVFDLPNIKSQTTQEQKIDVESPGVSSIRHYYDDQKLRIVIETQKKYLHNFTAIPEKSGLLINIGTPLIVKSTILEGIDFEENKNGGSAIKVTTSEKVAYEIKRMTPRWLRLSLFNCDFSSEQDYLTNIARVSRAVTAIDTISDPKQLNHTHVDIRLSTAVPYLVKQNNERLFIMLEEANVENSTTKAKIADIQPASDLIVNTSSSQDDTKGKAEDTTNNVGAKKYTGEKIALDFYNTDIHNVFRILADISGENFAIDKDVEGKVTLSLDNPVPWDQVLDLVLRMNQLGQQKDNNIIRIATLKSLTAEEDARIAKIKAKREEEEQADVVTEYILINYADAAKDVKPHLDAILSQNGKLSVDTRNNLIILTDVPVVITRAKEIVNEIDNATPQVLIEARIVEADNSFARELGLSWNAAWGIQSNDPRAGIGPQRGFDRFGGTYGWDTAVNFPFSIGSPMELGFNIARVAGTPFGLDARLRLLEINGNGRIVSAPKVLTLDSQEAVITQGQEYPYFEESESGGRTVKFKKVELKLVVTPHITPDGRVAIHIKIEKKDVFSFVEGVPILNTKEAETEFLMNDQDTLVIGGIHKTTERLSQQGYPWLSKIPFLGWLFKTQNKELDKEELLIFISPKIRNMERRDVRKVSGSMG